MHPVNIAGVSFPQNFFRATLDVSFAAKERSLTRPLNNFRIIVENLRLMETVMKSTSPWTTRRPKQRCPIFLRICWHPGIEAVVFRKELRIVFSVAVTSSAEKIILMSPFIFTFFRLISIVFLRIRLKMLLVAMTSSLKFFSRGSPGATFCLQVKNDDRSTVCFQCKFLAAGTSIQSPAICASGRVATIAA